MSKPVIIHWFRQDLRITDNPSLHAAAAEGHVLPVYIFEKEDAGEFASGGASEVWLHHSLHKLNESLGGKLACFRGKAEDIIDSLIAKHDVAGVYWNRCYEPWRVERDQRIKEKLKAAGLNAKSFNGSLLWEPWEPLKADGTPYKVFTPFYKKGCLGAAPPREPLPVPKPLELAEIEHAGIDALGLLPKIRWDEKMVSHWSIGEQGAHDRLSEFLDSGIEDYKEGRNLPAQRNVSRLSPHLHFGEISPNQAWYAAKETPGGENLDTFLSELGWREFSYTQLFHNPELPWKNLQPKFDRFPWRKDEASLRRWQRGLTGYPIVDAGMRELWETGYMHNRVRMIVGSFLVKNLLLHWRDGERWFRDCLFDHDLASNSASWQWVAGCGADAAPYFRVFNPVTQGEKFDAEGDYTRRWCPELKDLPKKYLYKPWEAPANVLAAAGVTLGDNYPEPIVDVKASRESALAAFQSLKEQPQS